MSQKGINKRIQARMHFFSYIIVRYKIYQKKYLLKMDTNSLKMSPACHKTSIDYGDGATELRCF